MLGGDSIAPETGINLTCRCGGWGRVTTHGALAEHHRIHGYRRVKSYPFLHPMVKRWQERHTGPGHAISEDTYRASCRLPGGCRWCGALPAWPKRFYCSDACRVEFERNHFWGTARTAALYRSAIFGLEEVPNEGWRGSEGQHHPLLRYICPRCEQPGAFEVNHVIPLLGGPRQFTCLNHLDNLEALCHACHVTVTNYQRTQRAIAAEMPLLWPSLH